MIGVDDIEHAVAALARMPGGASWEEGGLPAGDPQLVHDVRAYYEEAALALVDHVPAARSTESWIYKQTETGRVLRAARDALTGAGAPREQWLYFVPMTQ